MPVTGRVNPKPFLGSPGLSRRPIKYEYEAANMGTGYQPAS